MVAIHIYKKKMGPFNIHNWDDLFLDVSGCFLPRISVDGSPHGFDIGSDGFDVTKHRMGTVWRDPKRGWSLIGFFGSATHAVKPMTTIWDIFFSNFKHLNFGTTGDGLLMVYCWGLPHQLQNPLAVTFQFTMRVGFCRGRPHFQTDQALWFKISRPTEFTDCSF